MVATLEKEKNFEQIIQAETSGMALDNLVESSEKVSEVVGENVQENIPTSISPQKDTSLFGKISNLLGGEGSVTPTKKGVRLPSQQVQERKVKKALIKETRKLISEATHLQGSRNYSASRLEEIVLKIRHIQEILSHLLEMTAEKMERLYRKYVLKEG